MKNSIWWILFDAAVVVLVLTLLVSAFGEIQDLQRRVGQLEQQVIRLENR